MALSARVRAFGLIKSLPSAVGAVRQQHGFDDPPQGGGFGGPSDGFGGPPQQGGFGGPPQQGGFGGPPQQGGFGGPPQGGFGGPPQGGFGGPPQGGFGGPPQGGFGGPQGGFGGPPQGGFGGPPQGGFGGPPQGGFGGPPMGGFGAPGGMGGAPYQGFRARRREVAPIPDEAPFGVHLSRIAGLSEEDILEVFKAQKPTKVVFNGEMNAFIYFDNREDLVAALDLSGKEEVRFIRVSTSMRLKRLAEVSHDPPFRAHIRNLPPGFKQEDIMELFKDLEPTSCILIQNRLTMVPYGFLEFPTREALFKALDKNMSSEVRGVAVNPAFSR